MRILTMTAMLCLLASPVIAKECGGASIYSTKEYEGNETASGIPLDDSKLTAAHKHLKFGTKVTVTNKSNGKSVIVTITDRGPFIRGRIIDLTPAAAKVLGFSNKQGVVQVCIS